MEAEEFRGALAAQMPGLLRFARSLTRDVDDAEDLVQEALVRALERAPSFRGESSLATWLHRILHNLAVDQARRTRETPVEDIAEAVEARWREDSYTVDAAAVAARSETRAEVEDALVHVPIIYRAAVVLHDAEGLTVREVAEIQGVSLPAAKQRLRRGRMMVVSELARGHERHVALRGVPMRCWDARSRVSDFLDGELPRDEASRVVRHLEACPTCPPLYAALVATTKALRTGAEADRRDRETDRDPDTVVPPRLATRLTNQPPPPVPHPPGVTPRPNTCL